MALNNQSNKSFFSKALSTVTKSVIAPINEAPIIGGFPYASMNTSASGVSVTARTTLQHHAVYTCVRTLTSDIAKIPLRIEKKVNGGWIPDDNHYLNDLFTTPNDRLTTFELLEAIVFSVLVAGDSLVVVTRDKQGKPTKLIPMRPYSCSIIEDPQDGELYYQVTDNQLIPLKTSISSETGPRRTIYHSDMVRTRNLTMDGGINGLSLTQMASEAFGLALATQEAAARAYANGAHINGFFKSSVPNGKAQTEAEKESLNRAIKTVANAGQMAVINNMEWVQMASNVGELQLVEARREITMEVARMYRVPLHKIGLSDSEKAANIAEQEQSYITNTLIQYTKPLEQHLDRVLLQPNEKRHYRIRFDFSKQAEPNQKDRGSYYKDGLTYGWLTQNEVRQMEDFAPSTQEGTDDLRIPLNTGVAGSTDPNALTDSDNENDDSNNKDKG